jgi:hypothetical protein
MITAGLLWMTVAVRHEKSNFQRSHVNAAQQHTNPGGSVEIPWDPVYIWVEPPLGATALYKGGVLIFAVALVLFIFDFAGYIRKRRSNTDARQ